MVGGGGNYHLYSIIQKGLITKNFSNATSKPIIDKGFSNGRCLLLVLTCHTQYYKRTLNTLLVDNTIIF